MSSTSPFRGSSSGLTRQQLRARRYVRLGRDVYALAGTQADLHLRAQAALVALPDAVLGGPTAARLLGLPAPDDGQVHLVRPPGSAVSRRAGVVTRRAALRVDEVVDGRGLPCTSPCRTLVDLAPVLRLVDLVVLSDAVARRAGRARLQAAVDAAAGRPGAPAARRALRLVDPRSGSPAESRVRLVLHAAGFRGLRHGVVVRDPLGQWLAEPDLADEQARVAVQYDGLVHLRAGPQRWQADIDRDELTRQAGWELVVLTGRDLRSPEAACVKVAGAYDRSARRA